MPITSDAGRQALDAVAVARASAATPSRTDVATAVRYLLQLLSEKAPGKTVEVRVPPFGAVQVIDGPRHTRGTPANVVEVAPLDFIDLALGAESWADATARGAISASGTRADLSTLLPVRP